jgi:lipoyl(octanoyl) transferase
MIQISYLGRMNYGEALHWQQKLAELRKQNLIPNTLLFVEHPPVITLGRNAKESNVLASDELLARRGVERFEIDRGGDVTFHGPGQLVAYPIFDLRTLRTSEEGKHLGAVDYVRLLEEVLIRTVAQYGVETQRIAGLTGVWTHPAPPPRLAAAGKAAGQFCSERKIAAIGVHVSRGVTTHGFALNVFTDLDFYNLIVPCGLTKPVTSIEFETGLRPPLEEVMHHASRHFGTLLRESMLWLEKPGDLLPRQPCDTPARAPEPLRRLFDGDETHLA